MRVRIGLWFVVILTLTAATGYAYFGTDTETAKLVAGDGAADDGYGWSSDIDGDVAIVGANHIFGDDIGAAYIYRFDGAGWVEEQKLTPSLPILATFGSAVAVSGDVAVVNGPQAAYVFRYDGNCWAEEALLEPSDAGEDFRKASIALLWGGSWRRMRHGYRHENCTDATDINFALDQLKIDLER